MRRFAAGLSIRSRLVIGMVLLVSAGLAVANVSGILLLRSYLIERVDSQVTSIGPGFEGDRPPGTPPDLCANPRDPQGVRTDFVLLVLDSEGNVTCSLGPDLGQAAPELDQEVLASAEGVVTLPSVDGTGRWRVRALNDPASDQTLVFAVSLADADATVTRLTGLAVLVSALVLLFTAAAAWAIARLGLKPLERIEETAERIADGDLTERVPDF